MLTQRHLICVQAPNVRLWRCSKHSAVLTAELGRTLISHETACTARVEAAAQHQLSCLLQAQCLLVLQWAGARHLSEVLTKRGGAHVNLRRQFVNVKRLREILLQPTDSFRNLLTGGSVGDEMLKLRPVRTEEQSNSDLLLQQRCEAS